MIAQLQRNHFPEIGGQRDRVDPPPTPEVQCPALLATGFQTGGVHPAGAGAIEVAAKDERPGGIAIRFLEECREIVVARVLQEPFHRRQRDFLVIEVAVGRHHRDAFSQRNLVAATLTHENLAGAAREVHGALGAENRPTIAFPPAARHRPMTLHMFETYDSLFAQRIALSRQRERLQPEFL